MPDRDPEQGLDSAASMPEATHERIDRIPGQCLISAFDQLLEDVAVNSARMREKRVCVFSGQSGSLYDGRLMVVGRAVNGWHDSYDPNGWHNSESRLADLHQALARDKASKLDWVADAWGKPDASAELQYSTGRSAFWRVIRGIIQKLEPTVTVNPWPNYLAWSNLYKVAPVITGNPSARLARAQLMGAKSVLRCEIEELAPRRILFLTGRNWFDAFSLSLGFQDVSPHTGRLVQRTGVIATHGRIPAVVARHPQGKPEDRYIEEVCEGFAHLQKAAV